MVGSKNGTYRLKGKEISMNITVNNFFYRHQKWHNSVLGEHQAGTRGGHTLGPDGCPGQTKVQTTLGIKEKG